MSKVICIGVLAPITDGGYYGNALYHLNQTAERYGARIIVIQTVVDKYFSSFRNVYEAPIAFQSVDGWIILSGAADQRYLHKLRSLGKPISFLSHAHHGLNDHVVRPANYKGMFEIVDHLIQHGHRRVLFSGRMELKDIYHRYLGYRAALKKNGISFEPDWLCHVNDNYESARDTAKRILSDGRRCTAVACSTDRTAIMLIEELVNGGLRVPEDIAVTGFDDLRDAECYDPPLTTVGFNFAAYTEASIRFICERLQCRAVLPGTTYIPGNLAIRQSCGCRPKQEELSKVILSASASKESRPSIMTLQNIQESNYNIGKMLVSADIEQIKNLSWLRKTEIRWGCLGLWDNAEAGRSKLYIDRLIHIISGKLIPINTLVATESFPSFEGLLSKIKLEKDDLITLHPIRSESNDWGYLLLVGPMHPFGTYSLGNMRQIFNLMAWALDREEYREQLRKSEKINVMSELAASVAHEVRNPLTVVRGFLQLMKSRNGSVPPDYIETALDELQRAEAIISDYLDIAKPKLSKLEPIPLVELTDTIVTLMGPFANLKGNVLEFQSNALGEAWMLGDPAKLKQVMINLLKNAIEASTQNGSISLRIKTESNRAKIIIKDSGCGMTKEQIERLGSPYFSTKEKGTGLGLMVAFRLIEAMEGKIEYKSEPGQGTEVMLTFPQYDTRQLSSAVLKHNNV
ncbi:MAG: hypothetical protein K0S39_1279 [Paenibacillus sp.]|jgi:signal transduction histidine kinase/DNA-binding LacI/PurR family transcriptional regulator|nr:hypothetical protein [Paenibacillus sp.]